MKIQMFTIHDSKAHAYLPPFQQPHIEMAERLFCDACNDPNHAFSLHPADYTLFHIGEFDDGKGVFHPWSTKKSLGNGVDFIKPTNTNEALIKLEEVTAQIQEIAQ